MSKKIKVPYEYASQFFGNHHRFRWFEVTVADHVKSKTFVAELEPHSTTEAQLILAEKACAKSWIKAWFNDPRTLTRLETMGLMTVLDMGVSEVVATYGGDEAAFRRTFTHHEPLPENESILLVDAVLGRRESKNG